MAFLLNFEVLKIRAPHGKVKLTIEYDGTNYQGWQRQGEGIPTLQGTIESALFELFKKKIHLMGAGRTDSGVHAENQVAHFIAPKDVTGYNFVHLFQSLLPSDICIKKAQLVPPHFHAQRSALSKTYTYKIWNEPLPSALRAHRSLWIRKPLNLERLNRACEAILGTHDFKCFRSEGSAIKSTIRTIHSAKFMKAGDYIEFSINGNGFLKQMVRNIVGTLLQIEMGLRDEKSIKELMDSRERMQAGPSARPQGLYLTQVFYPAELDNQAVPL